MKVHSLLRTGFLIQLAPNVRSNVIGRFAKSVWSQESGQHVVYDFISSFIITTTDIGSVCMQGLLFHGLFCGNNPHLIAL